MLTLGKRETELDMPMHVYEQKHQTRTIDAQTIISKQIRGVVGALGHTLGVTAAAPAARPRTAAAFLRPPRAVRRHSDPAGKWKWRRTAVPTAARGGWSGAVAAVAVAFAVARS